MIIKALFCSIHYAESKYVFFSLKTEGKLLNKINKFFSKNTFFLPNFFSFCLKIIFGNSARILAENKNYRYLDDILIASATKEEHLEDLERVFKILEENGLVVNRKKCILGASSVKFLGHLVDANGIRPLPEKVEAIRKTRPPTSIKELRRFLGMVNYYRRFVKAAAHHLYYLFDALKASPKRLNWSEDMQTSFDSIKDALANSTMLHHPDPNLPLAITTDASDVAMGAVIEQRGPHGWEPLAFWSKKLSDTQQDWCPYDRELNAHKAIKHFKHMVEGRPFTLYTDH